MTIEKPQHATGEPVVPTEIKKVSKPEETDMLKGIKKPISEITGFDISGVPKRMRVEGEVKAADRVNPTLSSNSATPDSKEVKKLTDETLKPKKVNVETADVAPESTSPDRPRYHSIDVKENDNGFTISSYNPEINKVAKTRREMLRAIEQILDTPTKKRD